MKSNTNIREKSFSGRERDTLACMQCSAVSVCLELHKHVWSVSRRATPWEGEEGRATPPF